MPDLCGHAVLAAGQCAADILGGFAANVCSGDCRTTVGVAEADLTICLTDGGDGCESDDRVIDQRCLTSKTR